MGRKAKRKIARLEQQQRELEQASNTIHDWNRQLRAEVPRMRNELNNWRQFGRNMERRYHQELARYKFIDDILHSLSQEYSDMPLFRYMQGEVRQMMPNGYSDAWPPIMRHAIMPKLTFAMAMNGETEMKAATIQALTYYLFRQGVHWGHEKQPQPVLEFEMDGARRSYILPRDLMKVPEAEALQIVMREIAPAVLAMFKEIAERG